MFYRIMAILCLSLPLTPFVHAQVSGITSYPDVIEDPIVGSGTFSITAVYDQPMNTGINPTISFPTSGENPVAIGMLVAASAVWTDDHTFTQYYDVVDLNQILSRVDVQVSGGIDLLGNTPAARLETDLFCASTALAVPKIVSIINYHNYNTIYITFDQSTNFGNLSGTWPQSNQSLYLQFPELGDLSAYFDFTYTWITRYILKVALTPQQQTADFRDIHSYFKWPIARKDNTNACRLQHYWNGENFDLDYTPPYVTSLTTNLTTITESNIGTGTFQIIAQYNENVDGNVEFSFPTPGEDPSNALTLISTVKSNNDSKVTATYSVANVSAFIPDIDIKVSGATNEPYTNSLHELQTDTIFTDVFSVNTCAHSVAPGIGKIPDLGIVCIGDTLTVYIAPGRDGAGYCEDQYRYSTDDGVTWSAWSTTIPVFVSVYGKNKVQSRRYCDGNCESEINEIQWQASDDDDPVIICPGNQVVDAISNCSGVVGVWNATSVYDNCGSVTVSQSPDSSTVLSSIGSSETITLTADDTHGHTATCSFTITLQDTTAPTVVCRDTTVYLNASGSTNITAADVFQSSTDNCGAINIVSVLPNSFTCSNLGDNLVELSVNDGHGFTATCSATVTVVDTITPTLVCKNATIYLDTIGVATIVTADIFQNGGDNCGSINQVSVLPNSFTCSNLGDNLVELSVNDGHGFTATCSATVTVVDTIAPTVVCKNATIYLDTIGVASIVTADIFQNGGDNCGAINQVSVLPNSFTCSNLGDNLVELSVNDGHGNIATCSATVTVLDTIAPTVICKNATIYLDTTGVASIVTADIFQNGADNCGALNQVSVLPNSFICSNLGDNLVELSVNDGHGFTATCSATVTVIDSIRPTVVCKDTTVNLDNNGEVIITATDVLESGADNCGTVNLFSILPNTFTCSELGINTVTLTVHDGQGNNATCTATVMVVDDINPTVCLPLPVAWIYFSGKAVEEQVMLRWQTGSELHNKGFEVQKSKDGRQWKSIGWVTGLGVATTYQFVDAIPWNGANYYRLKQVDFDEAWDYSAVITVNFSGNTGIQLYPNPTSGKIDVIGTETGKVKVIDNVGRVIKEGLFSTPQIDISELPSGVYFIVISVENQVTTRKIIKE